MKQEQVAWGAASMLLKRHGDDAAIVVAQRIGELAAIGALDGVEMWQAIAGCMDQLMRTAGQVEN